MQERGTRGAYRKEDRVALPPGLQKELVEKAAAKYGNCQELAKHLNIPKSSVHYYRVGRLTMPISVLEELLRIIDEDELRERVTTRGVTKDRLWSTELAQNVYHEMCMDRVRLPSPEDLQNDPILRRKAAGIISYVMAEGSVWLLKKDFRECAANITFADHEEDLYEHFKSLCKDVFGYDIGPPQEPGNGARAIRGFIYSRFVAEWLVANGIALGDKASQRMRLPNWILQSDDPATLVSALQPWCDGEGCVHGRVDMTSHTFSLVQSRHTDLDLASLNEKETSTTFHRKHSARSLGTSTVFGIPVLDYCCALCRSEILDDVNALFHRLGFHPTLAVLMLHLKDDGFWSCVWSLRFSSLDTRRLASEGFVRQQRKYEKITQSRNKKIDYYIIQ